MRLPNGTIRKFRKSSTASDQATELTFCCRHRYAFLNRDRTRCWFVESLNNARNQWGFELWAYVIMPEHVHILLRLAEGSTTSQVLKAIKQPVSQKAVRFLQENAPEWLERIKVVWPTGRIEYRFWEQGGGYDRNIICSKTAWSSVQYMHMNPVRRGLVNVPEEWQWSSAAWYAGEQDVPIHMDGMPG